MKKIACAFLFSFHLFAFSQISFFSSPKSECLNSFKDGLFDPESSYAVAMDENNKLRYRTKNRNGLEVMRYAYCTQSGSNKWVRDRGEELIKKIEYKTEMMKQSISCLESKNGLNYCNKKYPDLDFDEISKVLGFD